LFALDAVDGSLDLFEFPRIPEQHELVSVDSRNRMLPSLSAERAEEILREKCCALFSSKDSSSFATPGWRLRGGGRNASSLLAWFLRWQRIGALPRAGRSETPNRRCKGVGVFRTVARSLIRRAVPDRFCPSRKHN